MSQRNVSLLSDDGRDTPHIGDIPLDAITSIESTTPVSQDEREIVDRDRNLVYKEDRSFEEIQIEFVLLPAGSFSADRRREEVMKLLVDRDAVNNDFTYLDYNGHLSVHGVEIPQESSKGPIHEGTINARYLPWPQYYPDNPPQSYEFFGGQVEPQLQMEGALGFSEEEVELSGVIGGEASASSSALSLDMDLNGSVQSELEMTAGEGDDPFRAFGANFGRYFGTVAVPIEEHSVGFDGIGSGDFLRTNSDLGDPQQFTISFWVEADTLDVDANNNYRHLVECGDNFIILEEGGSISFRVPGVDGTFFQGGAISTGTTYHVACKYDQSDRVIYVDGTEVARETIGTGTVDLGQINFGARPSSASSSGLGTSRLGESVLGASGSDGPHILDGRMDDVRAYSAALTDSQIQSLSNGAHLTSDLIAHWPMDEGEGFKTRDVVNDYDAFFGGTPRWNNPLVKHEENFYSNWDSGWGEAGWGEGAWGNGDYMEFLYGEEVYGTGVYQ